MGVQKQFIDTKHGRLAVIASSGKGPVVLLIHGNSARKEVFEKQFESALAQDFKLIAFDLPGHGESADATDPQASYTLHGYAEAAAEVLKALNIGEAAVFGWSLGGHIGLEMLAQKAPVTRLMITGTPPFSKAPEQVGKAFLPSEALQYGGKRELTDAQVETYARHVIHPDKPLIASVFDAVRRTDGLTRQTMFENILADNIADQQHMVENCPVPLAILNGAEDAFINNAHIASLKYNSLWEETIFLLPQVGHAAFLEKPEVFNRTFARFFKG